MCPAVRIPGDDAVALDAQTSLVSPVDGYFARCDQRGTNGQSPDRHRQRFVNAFPNGGHRSGFQKCERSPRFSDDCDTSADDKHGACCPRVASKELGGCLQHGSRASTYRCGLVLAHADHYGRTWRTLHGQ